MSSPPRRAKPSKSDLILVAGNPDPSFIRTTPGVRGENREKSRNGEGVWDDDLIGFMSFGGGNEDGQLGPSE